jgi:predicted metal-dependent HD superfamily phosphohydrolase
VQQVREEYAHVPDDLWRQGRGAVLRRFLGAPVLYAEPSFRARLDAPARANLARELANLA